MERCLIISPQSNCEQHNKTGAANVVTPIFIAYLENPARRNITD